jgi:hypothetical protein
MVINDAMHMRSIAQPTIKTEEFRGYFVRASLPIANILSFHFTKK